MICINLPKTSQSLRPVTSKLQYRPEVYSEPFQTSKIERFMRTVDGFYPLTTFEKCSILDIWQGSEYASVGAC